MAREGSFTIQRFSRGPKNSRFSRLQPAFRNGPPNRVWAHSRNYCRTRAFRQICQLGTAQICNAWTAASFMVDGKFRLALLYLGTPLTITFAASQANWCADTRLHPRRAPASRVLTGRRNFDATANPHFQLPQLWRTYRIKVIAATLSSPPSARRRHMKAAPRIVIVVGPSM